MKISKLILVALTAVIGFVSCKKDDDDIVTTTNSIEGKWVGTYVNDASGNSFYYSFNIKPGGILEEINSAGQKLGEGTWQLNGSTNVFTAFYKWPVGNGFSVIAAYDRNNNKLLGDWGYASSNNDGGSWQMTKVQ